MSGRNNTSQVLIEVRKKPEAFCNTPVQAYPTKYDSLYVVIDFGGFDLGSGKRMAFSGATQHLQYYQPSVSSDGKLFVHKPETPQTDNPNTETRLDQMPTFWNSVEYFFLASCFLNSWLTLLLWSYDTWKLTALRAHHLDLARCSRAHLTTCFWRLY